MVWVATAAVGAFGATGAAVLGGGALAAGATVYAANQAGNATSNASNAAINQQQQALANQNTLSQPYRDLGTSAIPQYQALLGLGPQGAAGEQAALAATPGYQFTQQQGQQQTLAGAASMGMPLSGNTLTALDKFNTGLADQTYQNAVGNVANAVGSGQAAAAGQAQNVGNAASNTGNLLVNQGNTLAGIDSNLAAGLSKIGSNVGNSLITNNTLANLNSVPSVGANQATGGGYTQFLPGQ